MVEGRRPRIPCLSCGSEETYKIHGPRALTSFLYEQRYQCRQCGQKFLGHWECSFLREYNDRPKGGVKVVHSENFSA